MKKPNYIRVVLAASLFCASIFLSPKIFAQEVGEEEEIEFGIDDTPGDPGASKTPILVPTAWLNGHVVDFHGTHADYVLRIVDSTNAVVYSTPVPSSQTQVWLPTYLVGIYRIELLWNGYIFYGYITL